MWSGPSLHPHGRRYRHRDRRRREAFALAVGVVWLAAVPGCARDTARSDDPRSGVQSGFDLGTDAPGGDPGAPSAGPTTVPATLPGVTAAPPGIGPMPPPTAFLAAAAAFTASAGTPSLAVTELVVQMPEEGAPYALLTEVDPSDPSLVVERMWRNGLVGPAAPTTPPFGGVAPATFRLDELDWPAIAAALAGAPDAVATKAGPLDGSRGVTHVIVQRDLPFSDRVVARVYVDGGRRSMGGYVQYLGDGSVDKVQA